MKVSGYGSIADVMKAYDSRKKQQAARDGKNVPPGADSLEISDRAREIKDLQAALRDIKDVREDLVGRVKKEIEAGAYRVDPGKIAEGMIGERLLDKRV